MNTVLKTILIVVGVLVVAGGLFFAGMAFMGFRSQRAFGFGGMPMMGGFPGGAYSNNRPGTMMGQNGYGPGGMMGGYAPGGMNPGGMMGGYGPNTGRGTGPGMMFGPRANTNVTPLTVDDATKAAQTYIQNSKLDGLQVGKVIVFNNTAYVEVVETQGGVGAFELYVNPVSKQAYPAGGADILWNLKYGGVLQSSLTPGQSSQLPTPSSATATMPVTSDQATQIAQQFLDKYNKGAQAGSTPIQFYGYYTVEFTQNGKTAGLISVNGYNGEVVADGRFGSFVTESK